MSTLSSRCVPCHPLMSPHWTRSLLPYLWENREAYVRGPRRRKPATGWTQAESQGLSIIGWVGQRFPACLEQPGSPSFSPPTFKGLSCARCRQAASGRSFFPFSLAAIPTPMDFSELLPALRQGIIDGQENPPAVVYRPYPRSMRPRNTTR